MQPSGEACPTTLVVALGTDTEHWRLVENSFPGIHNCCIHVANALRRERDDDTSGSGWDSHTRTRIMAKRTWPVIWEVAMCVLREFGILIILCNQGRHRSLTLAYELATRTGCRLVSMRDRDRPSRMLDPHRLLQIITPSVRKHLEASAWDPHPVAGIHVCTNGFDGTAWVANENPDAPPTRYRHLNMDPGHILVESRCPCEESMGWGFGTLVVKGAAGIRGWYPPSFVRPLDRNHFSAITDLYASLVLSCGSSDPAPQSHRRNRAQYRTCHVCHQHYFGGGHCINAPWCPRGRRDRP